MCDRRVSRASTIPAGTARTQLLRHGALPTVLNNPFGSQECGYHALLSRCERYSPDASHGQGSRGTRTSSYARVPHSVRRFPCITAYAARRSSPVAFPQEECSSSRRVTPKPLAVPVSVRIALTPTDYSLPSRLTACFRGHGCNTVLSPRGLRIYPLGSTLAYRQLLPVRLRSLPPYPLFLAESEGRRGVPVARLSLLGWSTYQPFGWRGGGGAGDSDPALLEAVNLLIL